ncbi:TonB-dependent receptor domain-containing protein [Sorangium sp. So ce1000]|uniref:TonB-dependent receptor domain-containing protein n=1 Tax=Sorangium sp. So ce1000 TaxID=3133325 RepID=UPI003F6284AE
MNVRAGFARRGRHAVLAFLALQLPAAVLAQPEAPKLPDVKAPELKAPLDHAAPSDDAANPAADASSRPPEDAEVILFEDKQKAGKDSVPATLPAELARNVGKNGRAQVRDKNQGPLTIEEIVNSPITSASNRKDSSLSAPAWVIVITAKDLQDRGYTDISQVLDDLPGMDIVRPYGDVYLRTYWRGDRQAGADPFLLMIDGVAVNHLFYRDTQIMPVFPLSNVDHIEIVYGPASAVYGANASSGVINVITANGSKEQESQEYGVFFDTRLVFGGPQRNLERFNDSSKIVDANLLYVAKDYRLRLTTRLESSVLDTSIASRYPYLNAERYGDPSVWGAGVLRAYPDLSGAFRSANLMAATDARVFLGSSTEIAAQLFMLGTGLGTEYPSDVTQTQANWDRRELSVYARHIANLSASVSSATLVQFRRNDIAAPSGYLQLNKEADPAQSTVDFIALESPNSSVVATQNLDFLFGRNLIMAGDELSIGAGMKYQHLELNGGPDGYTQVTHIGYPVTCTNMDEMASCAGTDLGSVANDKRPTIAADEIGAYLLAKYAFQPASAIHLGMRVDHDAIHYPFQQSDATQRTAGAEANVTLRGGYVGKFFDMLTAKLLYGQAVDQAGSFELRRPACEAGYKYKDGICKSEDTDATAPVRTLETVHSQSVEGNLDLTLPWLSLHADGYYTTYSNPTIACATDTNQDGIAFVNLDRRQVAGMDLGAHVLFRPILFWAYYSHYFVAKDSVSDGTDPCGGTSKPNRTRIGDLAMNKAWSGITFDKTPFTATLLARFIGQRDTIGTNPVGAIPGYMLFDANLMVKDVPWPGVSLGLHVTNIADSRYSQPGLDTADDAFYSSRLPQPGRAFFATMGYSTRPGKAAAGPGNGGS